MPEHEEPVDPAGGVELEQRPEGVLVEPLAAVAQRRDRRGQGSGDPPIALQLGLQGRSVGSVCVRCRRACR